MSEMMDFRQQFEKLILLQDLDAEIYDLEEKIVYFPARTKEIEDSLETKTAGINAAEEALKMIQVEKNDKDNDIMACEEKIVKHEASLNEVTTNKEYKALLDEIENVKADISVVEDGIIEILDRIDAAQKQLDEEKKIFEAEKARTDKEKEALKAEESQVKAKLDEAKGKRPGLFEGIDPVVLSSYDRIREKRGKIGLTRVDGEVCGECSMTLRAQIIDEARMRKKLVFCENCSRILYDDEG